MARRKVLNPFWPGERAERRGADKVGADGAPRREEVDQKGATRSAVKWDEVGYKAIEARQDGSGE